MIKSADTKPDGDEMEVEETFPESAKSRLIAVCGKGGVGKTAFTAMMSKVLSASDAAGKVLLIDADPAKGLTIALDVEVKKTMGEVREEIIAKSKRAKKEEKVQLVDMLDYMALETLIEQDEYALMAMGRTESKGCFCPVNSLLRGSIESLSEQFDTILIDGEAGLEQINRQIVRHLDTLIIISDATSRGLETARLVKAMVEEEKVIKCDRLGLVINRVQDNVEMVKKAAESVGVEVLGYIPQDENVAYHDLVGKALTELPENSPGFVAVQQIVDTVL